MIAKSKARATGAPPYQACPEGEAFVRDGEIEFTRQKIDVAEIDQGTAIRVIANGAVKFRATFVERDAPSIIYSAAECTASIEHGITPGYR